MQEYLCTGRVIRETIGETRNGCGQLRAQGRTRQGQMSHCDKWQLECFSCIRNGCTGSSEKV